MPRMHIVLFGVIVVFSFLIVGRAEDTREALRRAQDLEKAGQTKESILAYREVLHTDPQCPEAEVGLGRSLYSLGEYAQAVATFEEGHRLRPDDPEILHWLGRSYLQEKQAEKVLELVSREGSSSGQSASMHLLLAQLRHSAERNTFFIGGYNFIPSL